MANTPLSSATTTPTTPSSAWSRLVKITKTASKASRAKSTASPRQPNQAPSPSTHASFPAAPAKKHRLAESPSSCSATDDLAPLSPEPNDAQNMSRRSKIGHTSRATIRNHDCITACPCRVEDVDCVAPPEPEHPTNPESSLLGRQQPAEAGGFHRDISTQRQRTSSRLSPTKHITSPLLRHEGDKSARKKTSIRSRKQPGDGSPLYKTDNSKGLESSVSIDFKNPEDDVLVGRVGLEAGEASTGPSLLPAVDGLQEGGQNSVNKTPVSKRYSSSPASTDESIQLATPLSSPTNDIGTKPYDTQVVTNKPHKSVPAPKTKRRLTLYSGSYERHTSHKKRKTQSKRKDGVQTTLSLAIGSSAGMRECKLCDTVYNPFHPEDVKVHAKRHALAVKRDLKPEGVTESPLVD